MTFFLLTAIIILVCSYGILMAGLYMGWNRIRKKNLPDSQFTPTVSIIIPYRNERGNLPELIRNLSQQEYPSELLEYVFVNDHSGDNGQEILEKQSSTLPGIIQNLSSPVGESGKKSALRLGAQSCKGDIILLTDADCQFDPGWISSMVNTFSDQNIQMVQGPVLIHPANSLAGHLQQIEFMSLMMSAAGSAGIHHPILASGANLAVRRLSYLGGCQQLKEEINTGDDMFLLEFIKRENKKSIVYLAAREAIVRTAAASTFTHLWHQRKRWTSKATNYSDPEIFGVALLVLLMNLTIVSSLMYSIFFGTLILLPLFLWAIKTLTELPLIVSGSRFYSNTKNLIWYFVAQLIYPFYVVFVVIAGLFGSFNWKNREN
ncbi:MAG: glycosyltransferase [Bacteroidota bacterium]|nr:glycosyltransferase [Bacteroidota bacterium]